MTSKEAPRTLKRFEAEQQRADGDQLTGTKRRGCRSKLTPLKHWPILTRPDHPNAMITPFCKDNRAASFPGEANEVVVDSCG